MIRALWIFLLTALPGMASAVECRDLTFEGTSFTVCNVDMQTDALRLFLRDDQGDVLGQFVNAERSLPDNQRLSFAMNAGMYHADRSPVGLYVENGKEHSKLLTGASKGNFGLLPNGVLCLQQRRAQVYETLKFAAQSPNCAFATQSGPMLVIEGTLHPRFLPNSSSKHIRNGVGTSADGTNAIFAISNEVVNFHQFARLFRDELGLENALYLDGKVSRLYAPDHGRDDRGFWIGPIIGVVAPR